MISFAEIQKYFKNSDIEEVSQLLSAYEGNEIERVRRAVLQLSLGSIEGVKYHLNLAKNDYRDVLYWAENFDKSSHQAVSGMTVNERLWHLNLMEDYDLALKDKDEAKLRENLGKCLIGEGNIDAIIESKIHT